MSPDLAFTIVQFLPLPLWAAWIFVPRSRLARYLTEADWPWILLSAVYAGCLATAIATATGPELGPRSFTSLPGVMTLFDHPWGALAAWVHYLCFDTFVGRWIVQRAPGAGYRLAPILLATMMFGPCGLLLFYALRRWLQMPASYRGR